MDPARTVTVEGCRRIQTEMMVEAGQGPSWGQGVLLGTTLGVAFTLLFQCLFVLAVLNKARQRAWWRFW